MKKTLFTCFVAIGSFLTGRGQDCKVLLSPISLSYTGDCKDKKADGRGKAIGADVYDGEFKAGYPDGQGRYTWKTGDWFEGTWKRGIREGMGEMHFRAESGRDSTIKGFWKRNLYVGKFEKPYRLISKTTQVNTVKVTRNSEARQPDITITLQSASGGTTVAIGKVDKDALVADIPKLKLTGVEIVKGNFISQTDIDNSARSTKAILRTVEYPFRVILRISDVHMVELEFFEEGNYLVDIDVLN